MRYLLFSLLLAACAPQAGAPVYPVPSDIQPYLSTFEAKYGYNVSYIQYSFSSLESPYVGMCTIDNGSESITIDPTFWSEIDDNQKEALVMHELGHCVLFRAHLNTLQPNGDDTSVMNAYMMAESAYVNQRDYYLNELFNTTNVPMLSLSSSGEFKPGTPNKSVFKCK
jgi:hypothetical protein